jgi:hypothetical protein
MKVSSTKVVILFLYAIPMLGSRPIPAKMSAAIKSGGQSGTPSPTKKSVANSNMLSCQS